ncbi:MULTISPECIES: hypothetical protein [Pseudomonas]|uniref:Uncharacterized protein n=1 Tax=Pseudomonas frederiksbergensis TaxID=104087 RepID=A0A2S8H3Q4_9PSED|nr:MULTISPECIES: hypothetical protein [Pseudomonas]MDR8364192.1 hypothetical protein [Pseudomonas sp. JL3]PQO96404.1 hypothetical protein C5612_30390 [Pseudomonas frederiksbergensis]WLG92441.1 hypothetical protein PSH72_10300 [Pseudomonas cucumis]
MKIPEFLNTIIQPLKNAALLFIIGGFLLVVFGSLFATKIDGFWLFPKGMAEIFVKTGGAVLGAGVFAAIMKSAQFTEVFQRNIHEVFFAPELAVGIEENKRKWRTLTDSIFKKCLTRVHGQATQKISDTYFSAELDYHFEDVKMVYRFKLDHTKRYLTVKTTTTSKVVISPDAEPNIWQRITGSYTPPSMTSLVVDQKSYEPKDFFKAAPDNPEEMRFELPYEVYSKSENFSKTRSILLQRTVEYKQDIFEDPYLAAGLTRFVVGLEVAIKCDNCKFHFTNTGSRVMDEPSSYPDGSGYDTRVLAKKGDLLLPGMGFIIIITSKS